jgi:DDE superfamily endonuclease
MHLYAESGLGEILSKELLIDGVQRYVFGDSGYTLRPYLMTPFEGGDLTEDEALFNKRMSKARVSAEWAFKDVKYTSRTLPFRERLSCREHRAALVIWRAVCSGILNAA